MAWKLDGLDLDQATRRMVPSDTTLLGMVKHLAWVERWWFVDCIGGGSPDYPFTLDDIDADFRIEPGDTVASILEEYATAVAEANAIITAAENLDVTGQIEGRGARSLRWVLLHMIEETARHVGQADILREQIDGATGYYPPEE